MNPLTVGVIFTPRLTAAVSPQSTVAGVADVGNSEHGHVAAAAAVVNVQVAGEGIGLPLVSTADTLAVYVVPACKAALGVKVAVCVVELYDTTPATEVDPLLRVNTIDGTDTGWEKTALTGAATAIPVAPAAGDVDVTTSCTAGVTALEGFDGGPLPLGLEAVTTKVYAVPLVKPATVVLVGAGVPLTVVEG